MNAGMTISADHLNILLQQEMSLRMWALNMAMEHLKPRGPEYGAEIVLKEAQTYFDWVRGPQPEERGDPTQSESNLVRFAYGELQHAGMFGADADYDGELAHSVLDLIEEFSKQGHSGGSAGLTIELFNRLARFQPLGPLTGDPEEWYEPLPGTFQNRRLGTVFKDGADGQPYDIDGAVWRCEDGTIVTEKINITFPYTPNSTPRPISEKGTDTPVGAPAGG